jgi:uncharacterized protein involved in outer membrane biogenesis
MKKIVLIITAIAVVGLVAVVVILTLSLGSIIKKGVETVGPQITRTEMKLDGASVSLLSGSGSLNGFLLGNPEGYKTPAAIRFGEASVGVRPASVLSDKIHVTHVRVVGPEITFEGALGSKNNLSRILENIEAATGGGAAETNPPDKPADKPRSEPAGKGASKKLQVDDFLISGAKVNVSMTLLGGKALTVTIPDIHFAALGTGPDGITAGELTKKVMSQINAETLKAVEKAVADLGQQATDLIKSAAGKEATNALDKAAKGIGDLFKKIPQAAPPARP